MRRCIANLAPQVSWLRLSSIGLNLRGNFTAARIDLAR
jgi:hypothetical protein